MPEFKADPAPDRGPMPCTLHGYDTFACEGAHHCPGFVMPVVESKKEASDESVTKAALELRTESYATTEDRDRAVLLRAKQLDALIAKE